MTVHGAKGLEAPIVILADSTTPPGGPPQYQPKLLPLPIPQAVPDSADCFAWMPNRNDEIEPIAKARAKVTAEVENEYRRLLYVAMTRAADRLVVCGAIGKQAMPPGCWYQLVQQGLTASGLLAEEPADHGGGKVLRFRTAPATASTAPKTDARQMSFAWAPAWLRSPVAVDRPAELTIAPSHAAAGRRAREPAQVHAISHAAALLRGRLVHRLLQSLPEIPSERRADVARQFLRRAGHQSVSEHDRLIEQVMTLLEDTRFQPLFAPGSRAEVAIVGRLARPGAPLRVSGQVDRLAITADAVLIADYKTDRPAPRSLQEVPRGYLCQLALYRAVLARMCPGRAIRVALIFTDVPDLMEPSPEILDAEIAGLTSL
jgi:ATP-dependent helicase/nuclease subunit A